MKPNPPFFIGLTQGTLLWHNLLGATMEPTVFLTGAPSYSVYYDHNCIRPVIDGHRANPYLNG